MFLSEFENGSTISRHGYEKQNQILNFSINFVSFSKNIKVSTRSKTNSNEFYYSIYILSGIWACKKVIENRKNIYSRFFKDIEFT